MIKVKINGKSEELLSEMSIPEFLKAKGIDKNSIVFMLNEKIIKKDEMENYTIKQNDEIEILRFVSGG